MLLFVSFEVSRHTVPPGDSGSPMLTPHQLQDLGEHCKLSQWESEWSPNCKYVLELLRSYKMCLVATNVGRSLIFY